jgi:hypothetical protein
MRVHYFAKINGSPLPPSAFTAIFLSLSAAFGRQKFPQTFRMACARCHLLGRRNNNSWTQELQSAAKPEGE